MTAAVRLRALLAAPEPAAPSDGQLLRRFALSHDHSAFQALLHRHGPMVWGVCRRLLLEGHEAEDAFQATFLVLLRKAASIREHESAASWLYGVARRIARRARANAGATFIPCPAGLCSDTNRVPGRCTRCVNPSAHSVNANTAWR